MKRNITIAICVWLFVAGILVLTLGLHQLPLLPWVPLFSCVAVLGGVVFLVQNRGK